MNQYAIKTEFSGYCRGEKLYYILAKSEEEAKEIYRDHQPQSTVVIRDDTEEDFLSIRKLAV